MNHKKARQREDGRWDYTIAWSDDRIMPIGYCAGWHWDDEKALLLPKEEIRAEKKRLRRFKGNFHSTGHSSARKACECYKRYILDTTASYGLKDQKVRRICQINGCEEWTGNYVRLAGGDYLFYLCEGHMNRTSVSELVSVYETWSS